MHFACGATIGPVPERPYASRTWPDGSMRLAVYDSEGDLMRPQLDGDDAPCLGACHHKRAGGRKETRCFPSDETKRPPPWRYVITCYGRWEEER